MIFFTNLSQVGICYFYILLFVYLISSWFWTETAKTNFFLKISCQFLMGFHSKIYEILDRVFCIFPKTLGRVDPQQRFNHQNIPNWSILESLIFLPKILAGSGENWKKTKEPQFFSTGSHVGKWKKKFCFPWCGYIQFCSVSIPDYKNVIFLLVPPGWTILG